MGKDQGKPVRLVLRNSVLALSLLAVVALAVVAFAAPMPPRTLVNHQTRQCAQIVPGDECGDVVLPPGWEYLEGDQSCPAGYEMVELRPEWVHFKTSYCCTEGHSGSRGDCQDVVIQQRQRQCAFVEDIQSCLALPPGWEAWGQNCPSEFEWVDDLTCLGDTTTQTSVPAFPSPTAAMTAAQPTAFEPTPPASTRTPLLPCASLGAAVLVLTGMKLWWRG